MVLGFHRLPELIQLLGLLLVIVDMGAEGSAAEQPVGDGGETITEGPREGGRLVHPGPGVDRAAEDDRVHPVEIVHLVHRARTRVDLAFPQSIGIA
jgi:hypothetical protein